MYYSLPICVFLVYFYPIIYFQLEATNKKGEAFMISIWMKRIQAGNDVRCLLIMEPVDVNKGTFMFDGSVSITKL